MVHHLLYKKNWGIIIINYILRSIRKITFKPRWQTNFSVVVVFEWWVNTLITELGDIARHSAINREKKEEKKKAHPRLSIFFGGKKMRLIHRDLRYVKNWFFLMFFLIVSWECYLHVSKYTSKNYSTKVLIQPILLSFLSYEKKKNTSYLQGAWIIQRTVWTWLLVHGENHCLHK